MLEVSRALCALVEAGQGGALATVVRARGSTPQVAGARLLLRADGSSVGTVGGGAIERHVFDALRTCLERAESHLLEVDLRRDLGMSCGGAMTVFVEPVAAAPRLILCGAGHVAKPTAALARTVGFAVTVVDPRVEQNTEERFPHCVRLVTAPEEAVAQLAPTVSDWVLLVNYGHAVDRAALAAFGHRPHRYLGLMGSRRKVFQMLRSLAEEAALPPLDRVYAPVGLGLGAVTPEEIAVSIVAELVAIRRGGDGAHLRAVEDPRLLNELEGREAPAK